VIASIRHYLSALKSDYGLDARAAVLFGSHARGTADLWSDIDVVVLADRFDRAITTEDVELLWLAAATTDSRIEPIPCGERQWLDDDKHAIIEIARREGQMILPEAA
jgi:predicted nucleotidyltransferase